MTEEDIRRLRGIGEKRAQAWNRLGVYTVRDLISYFPFRYEDRSVVKPIAETEDGELVCISAIVADEPRLQRVRGGLELVKLRAADESGTVGITFFHQPYVRQQLRQGESWLFYGKIERRGSARYLTNPKFGQDRQIVPVYRLTDGLSQNTAQQSVRAGLDAVRVEEVLPKELLEGLPDAATAYRNIHFPPGQEELIQARRRFVFEELFLLCCGLDRRHSVACPGIPLPLSDFGRFYRALPFSPTEAQRRAVSEAALDLQSGRQMNRLLQGDVGSGKTLVAAALIWQCAQAGQLSAFMAPTEILAEQHYRTLSEFLAPFGVRTALLTGSLRASERKQVQEALERRELDLVVGTHALLHVRMPGLALAVTDEQHRFGVAQRAALAEAEDGRTPHVLVMSATPIPRTLALIIYGDLDMSVLDERPPGRQRVDTYCVTSAYHTRLLAFIRRLCGEGRQVFVVCPKVEEEEEEERGLVSAVEYAARLCEELPDLRVGCVHGRLKPAEKEEVMQRMVTGDLDVLVATTVIEVGVDIPNAALMLIENAERFGLSQLHQLRGRVGRGKHKSYCVLVTDHSSEETRARMQVLCRTDDGFRIAEEDLRLRGPGDFFGARQHGLPTLHVADLGADTAVLKEAKAAAERLLAQDPELENHPALRERIQQLFITSP